MTPLRLCSTSALSNGCARMGGTENEGISLSSLYGLCNGYRHGCKNWKMTDPLERIFLRAAWKDLVALSYEADPALLRPLVPPGLELDLFEGRAYVSLVGFLFLETRAMGVRLPFCQRFEEVNLRFYVQAARPRGRPARRGLRQGARPVLADHPRRPLALRRALSDRPDAEPAGDGRRRATPAGRPPRVRVALRRALAPPVGAGRACPWGPIVPGSRSEFLIERHWGYTPRRGGTLEYRVRRPGWRVCAAATPCSRPTRTPLLRPRLRPDARRSARLRPHRGRLGR